MQETDMQHPNYTPSGFMHRLPKTKMGVRRATLEQKIHILDYYHALSLLQRKIVSVFRPYVRISTTSFCEWVKNESELRNRYHRGSSSANQCSPRSRAEPKSDIDSQTGLTNITQNGAPRDALIHANYHPYSSIQHEQPQYFNTAPGQLRSNSEPQALIHCRSNIEMPVERLSEQITDSGHLSGLAPLSFGLDYGAHKRVSRVTSNPPIDNFNLTSRHTSYSLDNTYPAAGNQNGAPFDFESFLYGDSSIDDNCAMNGKKEENQYRFKGSYHYNIPGSIQIPAPASYPLQYFYGDMAYANNDQTQIDQYAQQAIGNL